MSAPEALPLAGCRLLYTRDAEHYARFAPRARAAGAELDHVPLLATRPRPLSEADRATLAAADTLLFTSANAVRSLGPPPPGKMLVAIGPATAAALGRVDVQAPPPFDSEALLRHWQPRGRQIVIVAAPGGRPLLAEALRQANRVQLLYSYERYNPTPRLPPLPLPQVVLLASVATGRHLLSSAPQPWLELLKWRAAIAGLSGRVAQWAQTQGFKTTFAAEEADESSQLASIYHWWRQRDKEL